MDLRDNNVLSAFIGEPFDNMQYSILC